MHNSISTVSLLCLTWVLLACSDKVADPPAHNDTGQDAHSDDLGTDGDVASDVASTDPQDDTPDSLTADASIDTREPQPDPILPDDPCPEPPTGDAPPMGRWSLSMFHFNVQYVAGGSMGFGEIAFGISVDRLDRTEADLEDQIIYESMVPLLGVLERNPELALTFEMQGYMVDIIRERHPIQLERMRALTTAGQLELVSTHWSDQFFLAFGRDDMDESWARTQASFEAAELPLSEVVFAQEGQFGEGFASWLAETRPGAVAVMARNLQGFYQDDLADQPLHDVNGTLMVLPRTLINESVDRRFNFFDDGELLATGDLDPYFGDLFVYNPRAVGEYEHRLRCEAENGYTVGRIGDYAEAVLDEGFDPPEMPPFLDGTWQPRSTTGPFRWMGGAGLTWPEHERDNLVLTTCVAARHQVLALDTVADDLGAAAPADLADALDSTWRHLLWGQVSDARGVNPWWGEMLYGRNHCQTAHDLASEALAAEASRRGSVLVIDTMAGEVSEAEERPSAPAISSIAGPIDAVITEFGTRSPVLSWNQVGAAEDGLYQLVVDWPATEDARSAFQTCMSDHDDKEWRCSRAPSVIEIEVPRSSGLIGYRPALDDELVRYDESEFTLQSAAYDQGVWSTVADGLIDLGDGNGFLIKDVRHVHVGVNWPPGEDSNDVVRLRDETLQPWLDETWVFWYTSDRDTAFGLADRNLQPIVAVEPSME